MARGLLIIETGNVWGAMRRLWAAAVLGFVALASAPARAELILEVDGSDAGCSACTSSSNTSVSWNGGNPTGWNVYAMVGLGQGDFGNTGELFDLTNLDTASTTSNTTLTVGLTETDLTAGSLAEFVAHFSDNLANISSASSTIYIDTNNEAWGEQTEIGSCSGGTCRFTAKVSLDGEFSLTEIATFTAADEGALVSDDDELDLPEPASLSLFGVGLLSLGIMTRRRRKLSGQGASVS